MSDLPLNSKHALIAAIADALLAQNGLAVGKLGVSEQVCLFFHVACQSNPDPSRSLELWSLHTTLKFHAEKQTGIFPTDFDFLKAYAADYAEHVAKADYLGVFGYPAEPKLIQSLSLKAGLLRFTDTEPDRSIPYDASLCYLPLLQGKRLLLVSPFASFARQRATRLAFEACWDKIGVPWFEPTSVQAIDIPYSFVGNARTFEQFGTSLKLREHICQQIDAVDFDVALIAAGSLAIPLAVHIKERAKVAISLGGHLQVLFGILGQRWLNDDSWCQHYINANWVRLPAQFVPDNASSMADNGAYW